MAFSFLLQAAFLNMLTELRNSRLPTYLYNLTENFTFFN